MVCEIQSLFKMLASVVDMFVLSDLSVVERIDIGMCLMMYEDEKIESLRTSCFDGFGIGNIVRERAGQISENDLVFRMIKLTNCIRQVDKDNLLTNETVKHRIRQIAEHVVG